MGVFLRPRLVVTFTFKPKVFGVEAVFVFERFHGPANGIMHRADLRGTLPLVKADEL